jgi:acyl carrier protein
MEELLVMLKEVRPGVDFENEQSLIDDAILDSFDIITIVNELNDKYGTEIGADALTPENFNSAEAILALVEAEA